MRPLTEEETKLFFEKLAHFIGRNIKHLLERSDGQWCFRLVKDRVYYVNEELVKKAVCFDKKHLMSIGTCFGKFTHHGKFKLHITALDYLSQFAEHKVWVKPSSEMSFLYGNHVVKGGLGRITEDTPQYQGVVVYSMNDIPLGFGTTAKSTQECRKADPTAVVVFNLADIGEYLRDEDNMFTSQ